MLPQAAVRLPPKELCYDEPAMCSLKQVRGLLKKLLLALTLMRLVARLYSTSAQLIAFVSLALLPPLAFAHGQAVLVTIYAELLTIGFVVLFFLVAPKFRSFWLGGTTACFLGVVGAWLVTSTIPYSDNQILEIAP